MKTEKKKEFRNKFGDLYHQLNMEQWIDDLLVEHDAEIIKIIDEMIEDKKLKHQDSDWESEILALTELKQKIQNDKRN